MTARIADVAELERIAQAGMEARAKLREIERAQERAENEKLIGKCFRYRNSYSCPETDADYWWIYARVTGLDEGGEPSALEFQTDKYGRTKIEVGAMFSPKIGWQECTARHFHMEWVDAMNKVKSVSP